MATWALFSHLQRSAGAGRGKRGMHGYVVLGGLRGDPWGLGALTPEQATEQIFPAAQVRTGAGHNQAIRDVILASVRAGQIVNAQGQPSYIPGSPQCAAIGPQTGPNNLQLAQTASGLALTGVSIGLVASGAAIAASAAFAPITMGISAIIGLFPMIFGHHAQAVKKEQSVLCAAVPAANNYLQIIDQAVQMGKATPQQAIQALQSLVSDFQSQVSSIMHGSNPMSSGECNAACVELSILRAIVAQKQSAYQDLANASTPAMTSGSGPQTGVVTSGATLTIPGAAPAPAASSNWLPIAALVLVGFLVMRTV